MEIGPIIAVALFVAYYFWDKRNTKLESAINRYASALSSAASRLEFSENDPVAAEKLENIAQSLRFAWHRKKREWTGDAATMKETWPNVCLAKWDQTLKAAGLTQYSPGYDESVEAVNVLISRLERCRRISSWKP
ncbi:hypothetical protein [Brevundimonas naejangsanensis]|uniref:hypothetical protein n=1 Tax=Brevundimonas naejangsanensis TaxID=588932 RepID=UPI003D03423F